ncbi:MAG: hypothetical protein E7459_06950 [Ruminococcaceae bacterium]|nr:hypothetical protein [Oscillospiraceae bacterium]
MMEHSGHRERVKQRYAQQGLKGFDEENILEMLLYYAIPRKDTLPIARGLLNRFDRLVDVLNTPVEELVKMEGVGEGTAQYLHMLADICRFCCAQRYREDLVLDSTERYGEYLLPKYYGLQDETVFLLCLNGQCNPVGCRIISTGDLNSATVPIRRIVEFALSVGAASVVLAHNHPNGVALPSDQDILATQRVANALNLMEIDLADHLVVAGEDFVSMAASGTLPKGRDNIVEQLTAEEKTLTLSVVQR